MRVRMISDSVATSCPSTAASPLVGVSRPQRIRIVVDFLAPLGPRNPKISPRFTVSVTWSTATKSPKRLTRSLRTTAEPFEAGSRWDIRTSLGNRRDEDVFQRRDDQLHTNVFEPVPFQQ